MADCAAAEALMVVSIRPQYARKILDGSKTVELRRRFPKEGVAGATALIYSSKPVQAIVGRMRIKDVKHLPVVEIWNKFGSAACVDKKFFRNYFSGASYGFAIIVDFVGPVRQQVPIEDLVGQFDVVPPQSFRYLRAEHGALLRDERLQDPH